MYEADLQKIDDLCQSAPGFHGMLRQLLAHARAMEAALREIADTDPPMGYAITALEHVKARARSVLPK